MITEDFVSFEIAKLLKEKGFDRKCTHCFALDTNEIQNIYDDVTPGYSPLEPCDWNHITEEESRPIGLSGWTNLSAPTLWVAMKWLREVHKMHVRISYTEENNWAVEIQSYNGENYPVSKSTQLLGHNFEVGFDSHEEACEAAIKYCLENLI